MALYGAFSSSMLGMLSQSTALDNIGANIANVSTGGYKKTDTRFSSVLSKTIQNISDNGGVTPRGAQRIDLGGSIVGSSRNLDAAIAGQGFFILNTEIDGSGETFYTRDGSFETKTGNNISVTADDGVTTITTQESYLVDKNGYYLMGWSASADGTFNTSGTLSAMRVDSYAFNSTAISTTQATLDLNLPAADAVDSEHLYNIKVYDTDGTERAVTLDFVKQTTNNTWTVTPQWQDAPTAQVDTITLAGTPEAGDQYTVTVGGADVTYTATGAEASISEIRDNLLALINANATVNQSVTAASSGTAGITLTANTAGTGFTSSVSTSQGLTDVAQVDTITLAGTPEAGDQFTVTIGVTPVSYTAGGASLSDVRDGLISAINLAGLGVTAAIDGANSLTLTADIAGTAFTVSTAAVDGGGTDDQTATDVPTTANYAALTDNAIATTTTTANDNGQRTGTATTLTFDSNAQLVSPTTLPISINWTGGGSLSMDLDISSMTQYSGIFNPYSYWQNGYGTGQLREITFDSQGHVVGNFTNTQTRPVYRLGLAEFVNPNGMEMISGNLFKESELSGSATIIAPSEYSFASISGNAREMSNVDVAEEFTNMILTQQAYNSSATVFRTVDEMTTVARDLKR